MFNISETFPENIYIIKEQVKISVTTKNDYFVDILSTNVYNASKLSP